MKRLILILVTSCALYATTYAQNDGPGVHFEQGLSSWNQIKQKAKQENKYIFVDCYTTWCGPCKKMDEETYPQEAVGKFFNSRFINIKLQMDKTDHDNDYTKKTHAIADFLASDYAVNVYPTYLFFAPDGTAVHKFSSFRAASEFIALAGDALNPEKQYYTMVQNFKPGNLDTGEMKNLAILYQKKNKTDLAEKIALDYLDRIPAREKFDSANLVFMAAFTNSAKIQDIVVGYLKTLSKEQFGKRQNIHLAVAFCNNNNLRVQALCVDYLKSLNTDELRNAQNVKFLTSLNSLPEIADIAVNYLKGLSFEEFGKEVNITLAMKLEKNAEIQSLAKTYISKLRKDALKESWFIFFLATFTKTTQDPGFSLVSKNTDLVNKIMNNKKYAQIFTDYMISLEIIKPVIAKITDSHEQPDWQWVSQRIKKQFDSATAYRIVLAAKVSWYRKKEDWQQYFPYLIEQMNNTGIDSSDVGYLSNGLNSLVYLEIFMHCDDKKILSIASTWMEIVLRKTSYRDHACIDTYANVLYKLGRVNEAISWESKALAASPNNRDYKEALEKMSAGKPTWIVNEKAVQDN